MRSIEQNKIVESAVAGQEMLNSLCRECAELDPTGAGKFGLEMLEVRDKFKEIEQLADGAVVAA